MLRTPSRPVHETEPADWHRGLLTVLGTVDAGALGRRTRSSVHGGLDRPQRARAIRIVPTKDEKPQLCQVCGKGVYCQLREYDSVYVRDGRA